MILFMLLIPIIILTACMIILIRTVRQNSLTQLRMEKYMELCLADRNPMVQKIREKIAATPDKELQSLNVKNLISNESLILLEEIKNFVKNIELTAQDPLNKSRAEKMTTEIESMLNLMATVDDKSSPEYVTQVCKEILLSVEKIKNNNE